MIRRPFAATISIRVDAVADFAAVAGTTTAGTSPDTDIAQDFERTFKAGIDHAT
jgi:hypothetical protein